MRLIDGSTGGGKTYYAVGLIARWLKDGHRVLTNIQFRRPQDNLRVINDYGWKEGSHGPWDLDVDSLIPGESLLHLVIDEAQEYFMQKTINEKWVKFFKEARHAGYDVLLITPDVNSLERGIKRCAEERITLFSGGVLKDPVFKIPMEEFTDLFSSLFKKLVRICRVEYSVPQGSGRWKKQSDHLEMMDTSRFSDYDSFSAPIGFESKSGNTDDPTERPRLKAIFRFILHNSFNIVSRLFIVGFLIYGFYFISNMFYYMVPNVKKIPSTPSSIHISPQSTPNTPSPANFTKTMQSNVKYTHASLDAQLEDYKPRIEDLRVLCSWDGPPTKTLSLYCTIGDIRKYIPFIFINTSDFDDLKIDVPPNTYTKDTLHTAIMKCVSRKSWEKYPIDYYDHDPLSASNTSLSFNMPRFNSDPQSLYNGATLNKRSNGRTQIPFR